MADQPGQRTITEEEFNRLQENYRKQSEQLATLKGTLDAVVVQRQSPPAAPTLPKLRLTPEAQEDVSKLVAFTLQQEMGKQQDMFRGAYNQLWDRTDLAEFKAERPGVWEKYKDKIESVRQGNARQNRFISRDEAYKFVFFEENGKKPLETKKEPPAPPQPVWDPYLQKYILPDTQPTQQAAPPPATNQQVPPPGQQPVQQVQPGQQPPAQKQPTVGLDGFDENQLPPQGPMMSQVATPPASSGPIRLDVDSPEATLQAFEAKFGDVPL